MPPERSRRITTEEHTAMILHKIIQLLTERKAVRESFTKNLKTKNPNPSLNWNLDFKYWNFKKFSLIQNLR